MSKMQYFVATLIESGVKDDDDGLDKKSIKNR